MSEKKLKPIDLKNLEPEEKVKYEIAEELGLLDKQSADLRYNSTNGEKKHR